MRPQQNNRRMRGRGNGNRKGPNPLNRSYESNGPDVKIRGTAQQIADKYTTLARDAQSSGDRVMAENYLQHAEHYNRLIAAAQAQIQPQQSSRDEVSEEDEREEREEQEARPPREQHQRRQQVDGSGPQPVIDGVPAEVALKERQNHRANGAKANGHAEAGDEEAPKAAEQAVAEEAVEPAPKPARRPRRTRPKASDSAADSKNGDASAEEAAAQG